jgi:hypothetical protein
MNHRVCCFLLAMLLVGVVTVAGILLAHGHEAPSGWSYPGDCCGGQECRPIACSTVRDHPDGSVSWLGLVFTPKQIRMSGDAMCHVCIGYDSAAGSKRRYPHCIFLSPTM